jgi:hypothetical protein
MPAETAAKRGQEFKDALNQPNLLNLQRLKIIGTSQPNNILVTFTEDNKPKTEYGQYFVKLPEELVDKLPGSYISPLSFVESFPESNIDGYSRYRILDNHIGNLNDLAFEAHQDHFDLRVYHGSTNEHSLRLSKLAARGTEDPKNRILYQNNLAELVKPVLQTPSDAPLRIVEDCLASGDTLIGVIKAIGEKTKLVDRDMGKITIDVAVATAQGILLLKKFAQDNGINLELNVGYLAYGLSEGKKTATTIGREHANYINYPAELVMEIERVNRSISTLIKPDDQVVGDMGDFSKLVSHDNPEAPLWNDYRFDTYGGPNGRNFPEPEYDDKANQHLLYLSNGGYLMRGLYQYFNNPDKSNKYSEMVFAAKRRWTKEYGYGVLFRDMSDKILK